MKSVLSEIENTSYPKLGLLKGVSETIILMFISPFVGTVVYSDSDESKHALGYIHSNLDISEFDVNISVSVTLST